MKILFTDVTVEDRSGTITGVFAQYEITDSDGLGNVATDSASVGPSEGLEPTYASLAAVQALTQTQIYNDFVPSGTDSFGNSETDAWREIVEDKMEVLVKASAQETTPTFDAVDNITDQTPISI